MWLLFLTQTRNFTDVGFFKEWHGLWLWEPPSILSYEYNLFELYYTLVFFLNKPCYFAIVNIVRISVKYFYLGFISLNWFTQTLSVQYKQIPGMFKISRKTVTLWEGLLPAAEVSRRKTCGFQVHSPYASLPYMVPHSVRRSSAPEMHTLVLCVADSPLQTVLSRMLNVLHAISLLDCSLVNCNFTLHLKYS